MCRESGGFAGGYVKRTLEGFWSEGQESVSPVTQINKISGIMN